MGQLADDIKAGDTMVHVDDGGHRSLVKVDRTTPTTVVFLGVNGDERRYRKMDGRRLGMSPSYWANGHVRPPAPGEVDEIRAATWRAVITRRLEALFEPIDRDDLDKLPIDNLNEAYRLLTGGKIKNASTD